MSNQQNISFEKLLSLAEGQLPAKLAEDLIARLPACDVETQANWTWIQQFLTDSADVPSALKSTRATLSDAFKAQKRGAWRRKLHAFAAISFDSWASRSALAPVGARSAETASPTRQLVFSAEEIDIALELRADKTNTQISGQILQENDDLTSWSITLFADGDQIDTVNSDDLGEFELTAPRRQNFQLALQYADSNDLITTPFSL